MPSPLIPILLVAGLFALGRKGKSRSCPKLAAGGGELAGYKYKEYVFNGKVDDQLPMVIYFHSRETGPGFFKKYYEKTDKPMRVILPYGKLGSEKNPIWFEEGATGDQNKLTQEIVSEAKNIGPFIDIISECRPRVGRPIITGHSQGGILSNALAVGAPDRFSVNIPVSGWLPKELWSKNITPTVAIHGVNDKAIPYNRTEDMVYKMRQKGAKIDLIPIKGSGHAFSGHLESAWNTVINKAVDKVA